jgi:HSP20 family protein
MESTLEERNSTNMNTTVRENVNGTGQARQTERFVSPSASVRENPDGYTLQVEMPGVNKEGLEISIENNELAILGRRSLPGINGTVLHRESRRENFRRIFEIDPSINANRITAKIEQGVVTLTLPKAEHVKPRKITIS